MQKRADHIATDLDKLKKALRDRGQLLGVEVKQKIPKEMPFGERTILWIHCKYTVNFVLMYDVIHTIEGKDRLMVYDCMPGWMKNLEEKAAEWDDWDDLMDRGKTSHHKNEHICFYFFVCMWHLLVILAWLDFMYANHAGNRAPSLFWV